MTNLFTLPFGLIATRGPEAEQFLQGLVTCDITVLNNQQANCGALCDPKGRITAAFIIFKVEDIFYLIMPITMIDIFQKAVKKYALFSKVEVEDVSDQWNYFGITQTSAELLFGLQRNNLITINHPAGQLILATENEHATAATADEWAIACIEAGFATIEPATSGSFTPHMLNLQKFGGVSFNKGCFLGQEIIARTEHLGKLKRHLYRISWQGHETHTAGTPVTSVQQETVGTLLQSAKKDKEVIGLAVIEDRAIDDQSLFINDKSISLTIAR